jgi:hypothetical protein
MQVSKIPPPEVPPGRTGTAANADQGTHSSVASSIAADRADIRPLDAQAALQILVAEVRASLEAFLLASLQPAHTAAPTGTPPPSASQAAQQLVDLFLRAVPQEQSDTPTQSLTLTQGATPAPGEPQNWLRAVAQVQEVLDASVDAALRTISAWRDVPPAVVETAREAHTMLQAALADEPQNPLWLRPEWLGLSPPLQRFRRRRRQMRRRLSDPDYPAAHLDDDAELDK